MEFLSRIEEILLLAIWKLQDNAYGVTISDQVAKDTGVKWMSGAIYGPLARLEKNGYVETSKGEASAERGGRHKILYRLTPCGKEKLLAVKKINESIWQSVPALEKK